MNWAWGNLLDQVWRSPAFPTWLTLAAAGFFGVIVIVTLLRAEGMDTLPRPLAEKLELELVEA